MQSHDRDGIFSLLELSPRRICEKTLPTPQIDARRHLSERGQAVTLAFDSLGSDEMLLQISERRGLRQ